MTGIENTERGITISKALAWTILSALLVAGIYAGVRVGALDELIRRQDRDSARLGVLEARQTAAERDVAVIATRLELILRVTERTDARVARMEIDQATARRKEPEP
jgi:DNA integrity scanning protein DisA with diadenylate cyclase activity